MCEVVERLNGFGCVLYVGVFVYMDVLRKWLCSGVGVVLCDGVYVEKCVLCAYVTMCTYK